MVINHLLNGMILQVGYHGTLLLYSFPVPTKNQPVYYMSMIFFGDFIRLMEKIRDTTWDAPKGLDIGVKRTFGAS